MELNNTNARGIHDEKILVKAPHMEITFYCANGHTTIHAFASEVLESIPKIWQCFKCGEPAAIDKDNIPKKKRGRVYKSHWDYLCERRSENELNEILKERLKIIS
jgi:hypothetical protein